MSSKSPVINYTPTSWHVLKTYRKNVLSGYYLRVKKQPNKTLETNPICHLQQAFFKKNFYLWYLVIDDPPETFDLFNDYSTKIGYSIVNTIDNTDNVKLTTYLRNSVPQTIVLTPLLPTEILNIIKSLNPNTATGYDNISSFFLCLGGDVLAPKLLLYFSTALEFGIIPQILRLRK